VLGGARQVQILEVSFLGALLYISLESVGRDKGGEMGSSNRAPGSGLRVGTERGMTYMLVPVTGGPPVLINRPIIVFGRHPACDVRLDSRKVSRLHCCLVDLGEAGFRVRDFGSTNGTYVNGQRVREQQVREGDLLRIADVEYRLVQHEQRREDDEFPTPPQDMPSEVITLEEDSSGQFGLSEEVFEDPEESE